MNAKEIVSKIRDNLPTDLPSPMYQQPNKQVQIDAIQTLLDKGIDIHVVNKPIIKYKGEIFPLYSCVVDKIISVPHNIYTAFIWCWFVTPFGKEVIRMAVDGEKRKYSIQMTAESFAYIAIKLMHRTLDDIRFIIHNHPTNPIWSNADIREYKKLKYYGFNGKFLLWCNGELFDIEDIL